MVFFWSQMRSLPATLLLIQKACLTPSGTDMKKIGTFDLPGDAQNLHKTLESRQKHLEECGRRRRRETADLNIKRMAQVCMTLIC